MNNTINLLSSIKLRTKKNKDIKMITKQKFAHDENIRSGVVSSQT